MQPVTQGSLQGSEHIRHRDDQRIHASRPIPTLIESDGPRCPRSGSHYTRRLRRVTATSRRRRRRRHQRQA
eukprot:3543411-Prymnesium_polylepis.2